MVEGDSSHPEAGGRTGWKRLLLRLGVLLVVVALAAGVAYRLDLLGPLSQEQPDPRTNPAAVAPPPGLELPTPPAASPVAQPLPAREPDAAAVRRALGALLDDPRLGRRVGLAVAGLDGRPVVSEGPAVVTPASTMKLLTCLAALETLGPEHRFATSVVASGHTVTLVGGGDPLLASRPPKPDDYPAQADVTTLAGLAADKLAARGVHRVRLQYDATLFTGPVASPGWEADYLPDDVVSPITALWVDEGRVRPGDEERAPDPSLSAAEAFGAALEDAGVRVVGVPLPGTPELDAKHLAVVRGAELVEVVQHVLEVSDNEGAEVLAHQVAIAEGQPASFAGAADAVTSVVDDLGVPVRGAVVLDGSGLSRGDRLPTAALLKALAVGAGAGAGKEEPELTGLVEGLPVAGFNGSLGYRFTTDADAALGRVRAKTGTLVAGGVHGLAGLATSRDGTPMLFVVVADRVKIENTTFVRDRLDQVAAALAGCACSATP